MDDGEQVVDESSDYENNINEKIHITGNGDKISKQKIST
jgi:hypothetical protein